MPGSRSTLGIVIAVVASATFGTSGAFVKPLLEAGWSPAAAVAARSLIGGALLLPFALVALRGRWGALWRHRRRVAAMAVVGVAATQLLYFAAVQRVNVGTAILVEYLAPILLVAWVWLRTRRMPRPVVLVGSAVAIAGLVLVVGPGALAGGDALGLIFAALAMVGCAAYYVIAAAPSDGLPPVALASIALVLGGGVLVAVGATGAVPFTATDAPVELFGGEVPWFVPLAVVGVVATAIAFVASISASELLGSRLASFLGLLEVVFGTLYAWLLLGETLTAIQLGGGALILAGIVLVKSDRSGASEPAAVIRENGADGLPGEPSPRDAGLLAR